MQTISGTNSNNKYRKIKSPNTKSTNNKKILHKDKSKINTKNYKLKNIAQSFDSFLKSKNKLKTRNKVSS